MGRCEQAESNPQSYLLKQRPECEEFESIDKDDLDFASLNLLLTSAIRVENLSPWGRCGPPEEIY